MMKNLYVYLIVLVAVIGLGIVVNQSIAQEESEISWPPGQPDFGLQMARGKASGYEVLIKFGRNSDIGIAFETLWNGGGFYTGFNATEAQIVEVFSSDVDDNNSGGTGARTVTILGLDADFLMQNEVILLDGVNAVESVNEYIRAARAIVLTAGITGENEGEITVRQRDTPANIFAVMPAGSNRTHILAFTIPANKTGFVVAGALSMYATNPTAGADLRFRVRVPGSVFNTINPFTLSIGGTSVAPVQLPVPIGPIPSKTDAMYEARMLGGGMTITADGFLEVVLIENNR